MSLGTKPVFIPAGVDPTEIALDTPKGGSLWKPFAFLLLFVGLFFGFGSALALGGSGVKTATPTQTAQPTTTGLPSPTPLPTIAPRATLYIPAPITATPGAPVPTMLPSPTTVQVCYAYHKVQRGESLGQIAAAHKVALKTLLRLNAWISNPSIIWTGSRVKYPAICEGAKP